MSVMVSKLSVIWMAVAMVHGEYMGPVSSMGFTVVVVGDRGVLGDVEGEGVSI